MDRVQTGARLVVADKSGPWIRVYANTDIGEKRDQKDEPMIGDDETTPPISGWIQAKGVVEDPIPTAIKS